MPDLFLTDRDLHAALHAAGVRTSDDLLALGAASEPRRYVGFVDLDVAGTAGRFHIKRYRYAGWRESRGLLGRGTLWGTPPEINEFRVLQLLRRAEVRAVRPVAACAVRRGGRLVAHALLTEAEPDAEDLSARLHTEGDELRGSRALRRCVAARLGEDLARMHAAGLAHRDCHARNVLVALGDGGPRLTWLDCRRGGLLRAGDAAADLASLDGDVKGVFTRGERMTALRAYTRAGGDPKRLVADVAALREKLPPPRR